MIVYTFSTDNNIACNCLLVFLIVSIILVLFVVKNMSDTPHSILSLKN